MDMIPDIDSFRAFFLEELEEHADEVETTGRLPADIRQRAADLAALRMTAPVEVGGLGLPVKDFLPYLETAAGGLAAGRMLVHVTNGLWRPLLRFPTPFRQQIVGQVGRGEALVGLAVTEPGGGSGRDLATVASPISDVDWRLDGTKHLITFAEHADWFITLARVENDGNPTGLTAFLVPRSAEGLTVEAQSLMGLAGIGLGHVVYQDVTVDRSHMLGDVGDGMLVLGVFLDYSRISLAACMVGLAQRALVETVAFTKERTTFGKALIERPVIQAQLANMYAQITGTRAFVSVMADQFDHGTVDAVDVASAKLLAADMVNEVVDTALKLHGGLGYTTACAIERIARDPRSFWFEEGTAEIQQLLIARKLIRG